MRNGSSFRCEVRSIAANLNGHETIVLLGSAPSPNTDGIPKSYGLVCCNGSAHNATVLRSNPPDYTFMSLYMTSKVAAATAALNAIAGLHVGHLVGLVPDLCFEQGFVRKVKKFLRIQKMKRSFEREISRKVESVGPVAFVGQSLALDIVRRDLSNDAILREFEKEKPSTGVMTATLLLTLTRATILMVGFSLNETYSYGFKGSRPKNASGHYSLDVELLNVLSQQFGERLQTTEARLSAITEIGRVQC
jgi:hypothetical protein